MQRRNDSQSSMVAPWPCPPGSPCQQLPLQLLSGQPAGDGIPRVQGTVPTGFTPVSQWSCLAVQKYDSSPLPPGEDPSLGSETEPETLPELQAFCLHSASPNPSILRDSSLMQVSDTNQSLPSVCSGGTLTPDRRPSRRLPAG